MVGLGMRNIELTSVGQFGLWNHNVMAIVVVVSALAAARRMLKK